MDKASKKTWKKPEIAQFCVSEVTEGVGGTVTEGFFNTEEDPMMGS